MATGKRYYWIKLKESFLASDQVDYMMSQPDGANYVVLYQMLCLKTINTGGKLSRKIGEIIIPYDVDKIQRDCKWFSVDTIRVALQLYKSLGLIYENQDGVLVLADHQNLVGSETDYAEKKKRQRQNTQLISSASVDKNRDTTGDNVPQNVPIDIREEDSRYKDSRYKEDRYKEGEAENAPTLSAASKIVFKTYESLIGVLTPRVVEIFDSYKLIDELKIKAIQEAHDNNKKSIRYIEAILRRYEKENIKVVADLDNHPQKSTGIGNRNNSNYDFEDIERLELERMMKKL